MNSFSLSKVVGNDGMMQRNKTTRPINDRCYYDFWNNVEYVSAFIFLAMVVARSPARLFFNSRLILFEGVKYPRWHCAPPLGI
jgi:hypothetical protein